jgi:hypothetical protein
METNVKRLLEIPARKHERKKIEENNNALKRYLLVIDFRIFRFEYSKEILPKDPQ